MKKFMAKHPVNAVLVGVVALALLWVPVICGYWGLSLATSLVVGHVCKKAK